MECERIGSAGSVGRKGGREDILPPSDNEAMFMLAISPTADRRQRCLPEEEGHSVARRFDAAH